jgi:hypothetical protein
MDKGFAGRFDLISGNCGYASSTGAQNETYQVYNAKEQRRSEETSSDLLRALPKMGDTVSGHAVSYLPCLYDLMLQPGLGFVVRQFETFSKNAPP